MNLSADLRRSWPLADGHRATVHPDWCDACLEEMPCAWSQITADIHRAADALEKYERAAASKLGYRLREASSD